MEHDLSVYRDGQLQIPVWTGKSAIADVSQSGRVAFGEQFYNSVDSDIQAIMISFSSIYARKRRRDARGAAMADAAAALTFALPIIIIAGFVAGEVAQAYMIHSALTQCAYRGARALAIAYGNDPVLAQANYQTTFNNLPPFLNIVNSGQQYSVASWSLVTNPPTVTVTCTYQSGQHGLPKFPYPDPLNIGSKLTLSAQETCRLE
jgi:hypothetical protein